MLFLHQELELLGVSINGEELPWDGQSFKLTEECDLIIPASVVPRSSTFTLETKVRSWHCLAAAAAVRAQSGMRFGREAARLRVT